MSRLPILQIPASPTGAAPTPQQKRFNTLIRQIEKARETLAAWGENVALYRQAHVQVVLPLHREYHAALRLWVLALDALVAERSWTKAEGVALRALIREGAANLLAAGDDEEIRAVFDRHAEVDYDTEMRERVLALKDLAEEMTGLDLGDDDEIDSEEALRKRVREGMEQQAASEQARQEKRAARKKKTAAQQRREAEEQQATQSVREIYRKLASSLHPDRETDETQRAAKTELMQRVNQAYAAGDLLALLELQLRIEQIDASHVASASESRLKHYNQVLGEQLAELKAGIEEAGMRWKIEFGLPTFLEADPRRLASVLDDVKRACLEDLAEVQKELRILDDVAATKRWLKRMRQELQRRPPMMPF